jgi:hypothetical protein
MSVRDVRPAAVMSPHDRWGLWFGVAAAILSLAGRPAAAADKPKPEKAERFRYHTKGRRDPFVPLVRDGRLVAIGLGGYAKSSQPVLYGVLWDPGGNSIALINDGEVRVGDMIGDYRVVEIRKDAVVLANGGEPVVIELAFETPPTSAPGAAKGGGQP